MEGSKIHRITFSRSLAEHICRITGRYRIHRIKFRTGRLLKPGERSKNGLYAIQSSQKDITLRIAMDFDIAQELCDFDNRHLKECWIEDAKAL